MMETPLWFKGRSSGNQYHLFLVDFKLSDVNRIHCGHAVLDEEHDSLCSLVSRNRLSLFNSFDDKPSDKWCSSCTMRFLKHLGLN